MAAIAQAQTSCDKLTEIFNKASAMMKDKTMDHKTIYKEVSELLKIQVLR
jgi:hypothetical protein